MSGAGTDGTAGNVPYEDILVPTDGSGLAVRALDEALSLAGLTGATVHVVYVVDDAAVAELATASCVDEVSFDADVGRLFERFEAVGERAIADVREAAGERGAELVTEVRRGIPDESILEYADENGVDLIVMGTHGRRGVRRYLLGSTTEQVLRQSPVPVLAVRDVDSE